MQFATVSLGLVLSLALILSCPYLQLGRIPAQLDKMGLGLHPGEQAEVTQRS